MFATPSATSTTTIATANAGRPHDAPRRFGRSAERIAAAPGFGDTRDFSDAQTSMTAIRDSVRDPMIAAKPLQIQWFPANIRPDGNGADSKFPGQLFRNHWILAI